VPHTTKGAVHHHVQPVTAGTLLPQTAGKHPYGGDFSQSWTVRTHRHWSHPDPETSEVEANCSFLRGCIDLGISQIGVILHPWNLHNIQYMWRLVHFDCDTPLRAVGSAIKRRSNCGSSQNLIS
jgi:hypothetical protein